MSEMSKRHESFHTRHPVASECAVIGGVAIGIVTSMSVIAGEIDTGDALQLPHAAVHRWNANPECKTSPEAAAQIDEVLSNPNNVDTGGEGPSSNFKPLVFAQEQGVHIVDSQRAVENLNHQSTAQGVLDAINAYTSPNQHFKVSLRPPHSAVGTDQKFGLNEKFYTTKNVPLDALKRDGIELLDNLGEMPVELQALAGLKDVVLVKHLPEKGRIAHAGLVTAGLSANFRDRIDVIVTIPNQKDGDFASIISHERAHQVFRHICGSSAAIIPEFQKNAEGKKIHYGGTGNDKKAENNSDYVDTYASKTPEEAAAEIQAGITANKPRIDRFKNTQHQAIAEIKIIETAKKGVGQYLAYLDLTRLTDKPNPKY
jgi:hypothetical protein